MSLYSLIRLCHLIGIVLLAAGLIGAFAAELRMRSKSKTEALEESLYYQDVFGKRLIFPGAVLAGGTGLWLVLLRGQGFFAAPWLTAMWMLFLFEFVEGTTHTRAYGVRLNNAFRDAGGAEASSAALRHELASRSGAFARSLDLTLALAMVSLGMLRPMSWTPIMAGILVSAAAALLLTRFVLRIEPHEMPCSARRNRDESVHQAPA